MLSNLSANFLLLIIVLFVVGIKANKNEQCKDDLENCEDFNQRTCVDNPTWARTYCSKTCGICTTPTCPEGWLTYAEDRTCIKGFGFNNRDEVQTWSGARQRCSNYGADLVVIKDDNKRTFVLDHYSMNKYMWIGLHSVAKENNNFTFVYVDGSPFGSYHPWEWGNPDNHANKEKCVLMYPNGSLHGRWNDYGCNVLNAFVCSKTLS